MKSTNIRLFVIFMLILLVSFVIIARLVFLQVWCNRWLSYKTERMFTRNANRVYHRGKIYDRNFALLAGSADVYSLGINPSKIEQKDNVALLLSNILGMDFKVLQSKIYSNSHFVWIKRKIEPEVVSVIRQLCPQKGFIFQQESKRYHPEGSLSSQLLGVVGIDGLGLSGIEYTFDAYLRSDSLGQFYKKRDGINIVLTIDKYLQYMTEKILKKYYNLYRAKSAIAIIQNPTTGEILAMVNIPNFDPDGKFTVSDLKNNAIQMVFEPGSVFKVVPLAAVLEEGYGTKDEMIFCEKGVYALTDKVKITDHEKYGMLSFEDVVAYSSNIGISKVALRLSPEKLYNWARKFGFGNLTSINLSGESKGILYKPDDKWTSVSTAKLSFGYGVCVTPIQLVCAYSVIANGGILYEPQIVRYFTDSDNNIIQTFEPRIVRKVLSRKTAKILQEIFEKVVQYGTGVEAKIPGYRIAGKTGTAQKLDPQIKKYMPGKYICSFCGFFLDKFDCVILVILDEPNIYWASSTAVPIFREIATVVIEYMNK